LVNVFRGVRLIDLTLPDCVRVELEDASEANPVRERLR
jgi:hypothetical protein